MKKVYLLIYQRCILTSVLMALCLTLAAQNRAAFRARAEETQSRRLRSTITTSDTISLEGMGTIYSLSIDATIHQPREASFTRIVLEDTDGHDYLVAESDWFRNDTTTITLDHFCEETALLEGIIPHRLKCYLSGEVTLTLNGIHLSTQPAARKAGSLEETAESIRLKQVQNIVNRINVYNGRHHKLWRARVSDIASMSYNDKKRIFHGTDADSYLADFVYYGSGIYELGNVNDSIVPEPISYCVDSFDWCNRHGKNWITKAKDQGVTGFCQTFAVVGMTEAVTRLYFNDTLSIDLSEQDVISYTYNNMPNSWATLTTPCSYIIDYGVIDEETLPFDGYHFQSTWINPRPEGEIQIGFNYITYLSPYLTGSEFQRLDMLKRALINKGPAAVALEFPGYSHAMLLHGYGKVHPGMYWTYGPTYDNDQEGIDSTDIRNGRTYWMFKNSWGESWGEHGFTKIICYDYHKMPAFCFIASEITSTNLSEDDIVFEDHDGDGYYYWGIGSSPSSLPSWAPRQKDGDDNNCLFGPLTYNGFPTNIDPDNLPLMYIDRDSTINDTVYIANHICVRYNSTLRISGFVLTNKTSDIQVESGSTLLLDGGTLRNAVIRPQIGSTIRLTNGGKIISNKNHGFSIPQGVILDIEHGSIE